MLQQHLYSCSNVYAVAALCVELLIRLPSQTGIFVQSSSGASSTILPKEASRQLGRAASVSCPVLHRQRILVSLQCPVRGRCMLHHAAEEGTPGRLVPADLQYSDALSSLLTCGYSVLPCTSIDPLLASRAGCAEMCAYVANRIPSDLWCGMQSAGDLALRVSSRLPRYSDRYTLTIFDQAKHKPNLANLWNSIPRCVYCPPGCVSSHETSPD